MPEATQAPAVPDPDGRDMTRTYWTIVAAYLVLIARDGRRRVEGRDELGGYFVPKRSLPWWSWACR